MKNGNLEKNVEFWEKIWKFGNFENIWNFGKNRNLEKKSGHLKFFGNLEKRLET